MISFKVEISPRTDRLSSLIVTDSTDIGARSITMGAKDVDRMLASLSRYCELIDSRLIQIKPNPAPFSAIPA